MENNGFNGLRQYLHLGHCFIAHSNGINVMLQFIVLSSTYGNCIYILVFIILKKERYLK